MLMHEGMDSEKIKPTLINNENYFYIFFLNCTIQYCGMKKYLFIAIRHTYCMMIHW